MTSSGTLGSDPRLVGNFVTSANATPMMANPLMSPTPQNAQQAGAHGMFSQPFSFGPPPQGIGQQGLNGVGQTMGQPPSRGNLAQTAPNLGSANAGASAPMPTPFSAAGLCQQLDATALPPTSPVVSSAFEMLGKPAHAAATVPVDPQETMLKALTAALSGDRKSLPTWSGDVATLRSWLRQLTLWEMDNNLPRHKWGLKLLQAFGDQTPPRRIAEAVDLATLTSENGYAALLTAIMAKYGPYLEAAGPAAIEAFFYGTERNKNENLSSYVATKEIALQELESNLGEKLPPRIAGRILLRHANLSDAQREAMAVKYNALLTFEQAAAALRPLDRPDALVQKVTKNFAAASTYVGAAEAEDDEEELIEDNDGHEESEGPESDGQGNLTYSSSTLKRSILRRRPRTSGRTTAPTRTCVVSCRPVERDVSSSRRVQECPCRRKGRPKVPSRKANWECFWCNF